MTTWSLVPEPRDAALVGLVAGWLPGRRWFPLPPEQPTTFEAVGGVTLADPRAEAEVRILLVRARSAGADVLVQVPLTLRALPASAPRPATPALTGADAGPQARPAEADVVGVLADPPVEVRDGCGEAAFLRAWLAAAAGPGAAVEPDRARVLTGEQSNTSVVLPASHVGGPAGVLKVFRTLTPGDNPDVDVPRALSAAGWPHVPEPLAWMSATWPEPDGSASGHLAVMSRFIPDAQDGFELACAMARDGRSFADLARALGAVVAGMHAALARALPVTAGASARSAPPPVDQDRAGAGALGHTLRRRLAWAVQNEPALSRYAPAVEVVASRLAALTAVPAPQRIHGDLHLGQVLWAERTWYVMDFEGEPLLPVADRARPDLALRDVAGMLRSLDYAGAVGSARPGWVDEARAALLDGYGLLTGPAGGPAQVLRALELDKALYEAVYEARNRPDWIQIPIVGIERLLATDGAG